MKQDSSNPENSSAPECLFFSDQLHRYLECELDDTSTARVSAHLENCRTCGAQLKEFDVERQKVLEKMFVLPELSSSFSEKVIDAIREETVTSHRRSRLLRGRFVAGMAAGVLLSGLAVTIVLVSLNPSPNGPGNGTRIAELTEQRSVPAGQNSAPVLTAPAVTSKRASHVRVVKTSPADLGHSSKSEPTRTIPVELATLSRRPEELRGEITAKDATYRVGRTIRSVSEKILDDSPCTEDINNDGKRDLTDVVDLVAQGFVSGRDQRHPCYHLNYCDPDHFHDGL